MNTQVLEETPPADALVSDEAGIGTLGIVLIVILLLILFGVIGFSFS